MKRTILFLTFAIFTLLSSCGSGGKSEEATLREQVIAIHDEVMPKMGQLKSFEKEALHKAESLETSENPDEAKIEELKALAYDLDQAYDQMFAWMRTYTEGTDQEMTEEETMTFLDEQMITVKEVRDQINGVLDEAKEKLQ
ncbi:hypothetical protein PBT90_13395 [Algoriphagus halophytocola]|uniref:Viral A-type inclusion protein n=1 Tax=Algoriphagus halophytocola TaxID=2991499 RepID=A0ABY6MKS0_9BACT|nr:MULTISPECIES: hypothetical protein [unclassified Algoriphagus]UZD24380.1 hypothetical protein OM944_07725 [Algoriphagus sp. TR-M5]WBL41748.1 hypothetical protein PBT90_13395 [Algoriphagus sp. TR-M9]